MAEIEDYLRLYINDKKIERSNYLLKLHHSEIKHIEIGPDVEEISDWPNAFCDCENLESFSVDSRNKHFEASCYQQLSMGIDSQKMYLIQKNYLWRGHVFERALHTFPAKVKANELERLSVDVDIVKESGFIGRVEADFLTLNNCKAWICPEVYVIGQRCVFITETNDMAEFLAVENKIKAIDEQSFLQITSSLGSTNGRAKVKEIIEKAFKENGWKIEQ